MESGRPWQRGFWMRGATRDIRPLPRSWRNEIKDKGQPGVGRIEFYFTALRAGLLLEARGGKTVKKQGCVLAMGGEIRSYPAFAQALEGAGLVLAADSGARHFEGLRRWPDAVMGDLDSLSEEKAALWESRGCRMVRVKPEKNDTDGSLILKEAMKAGWRQIEVWGALGGRPDHSYANIALLELGALAGAQVVLKDGDYRIFLPYKGEKITGRPGDYVSLFALTDLVTGFRNKGLKYQPAGGRYVRSFPLGVSNELTGTEAVLDWESGRLLCMIVERD